MSSTDLTKADVEAALARPLEERDGRWHCQVCDRGFVSKQAIGPHQLQHRRAVGLAPRKAPQTAALLPIIVDCKLAGCRSQVRRAGYRAHLRNVHRLTPTAAERALADRVEDYRRGGTVPAVVEAGPEPEPVVEAEPEPVVTDLSAVDAAAGILSAALRDGLVPVAMLGSVVDWIGHTDQLLAELARQRGEQHPR